jgi:hypothetical protein
MAAAVLSVNRGWSCAGRWIEICVLAVGLVQYVGRLNLVGRQGYRFVACKELQSLLSPRENLLRVALRGL